MSVDSAEVEEPRLFLLPDELEAFFENVLGLESELILDVVGVGIPGSSKTPSLRLHITVGTGTGDILASGFGHLVDRRPFAVELLLTADHRMLDRIQRGPQRRMRNPRFVALNVVLEKDRRALRQLVEGGDVGSRARIPRPHSIG